MIGGKLKLKKREFVLHGSPRSLALDPVPMTYNSIPTIERIKQSLKFHRGTATSLTKMFENLHKRIKPLRQQFYHDIGIPEDSKIREIYPDWDKKAKKVVWINELVSPSNEDDRMRDFLNNNPFKGIEYFFGEYTLGIVKKPDSVPKLQWENFKFCFCMTILELHCLLTGKSILEMMKEAKWYIYKDKQGFIECPVPQAEAVGAVKKSCDRCGKNYEISEKERRKYEHLHVLLPNKC